ncbi:DUF2934 domain-containing protein [uncultured Devosia sp.]|uniref:DUF2934 domain-containing protein n=1 Tax=uncultured Devosia sp. TaxID=211434 RepID=UPI0035CA0E21
MADMDDEKIRELAYQLWEKDGSPDGKDDHYWHAARELLADEGEVGPTDDPIVQIPIVPMAGLITK